MLEYQKVLLIQLRQLGDFILSTPCIREIRRELPNAHISFLCHKMGKQVLESNPYLDQLICYHEKASYRDYFHKFAEIRHHSYDMVIDFMNDPRSGIFTLVSKGKAKISIDSSRRLLYDRTFPRANDEETYIVDEKFNLLRQCGFNPQDRRLDFPWFNEHLAPVKQLFSTADYKEGNKKLIYNLGDWALCPQICYDLRFPAWCRNSEDYDILVITANWPNQRIDSWEALLKARAVENQCYVLGVNCVGEDAFKNQFDGYTSAYSYDGSLIEKIVGKEGVIHIEIDKQSMMVYRERFPFLKDRDTIEIKS